MLRAVHLKIALNSCTSNNSQISSYFLKLTSSPATALLSFSSVMLHLRHTPGSSLSKPSSAGVHSMHYRKSSAVLQLFVLVLKRLISSTFSTQSAGRFSSAPEFKTNYLACSSSAHTSRQQTHLESSSVTLTCHKWSSLLPRSALDTELAHWQETGFGVQTDERFLKPGRIPGPAVFISKRQTGFQHHALKRYWVCFSHFIYLINSFSTNNRLYHIFERHGSDRLHLCSTFFRTPRGVFMYYKFVATP